MICYSLKSLILTFLVVVQFNRYCRDLTSVTYHSVLSNAVLLWYTCVWLNVNVIPCHCDLKKWVICWSKCFANTFLTHIARWPSIFFHILRWYDHNIYRWDIPIGLYRMNTLYTFTSMKHFQWWVIVVWGVEAVRALEWSPDN